MPHNDIYITVSKNIKKYRILSKMTQFELSKLTGLSYSYIRKLESNQIGISLDTLNKIAYALKVDIKHLLDERNI